jgi:hypothetical protein
MQPLDGTNSYKTSTFSPELQMAQTITLRHKTSGIMKEGFYGFSWTTLFFGCFPALFRGDFLTFIGIFVVLLLLGIVTFGIGTFFAMFIWAFFYNGYYTKRLLEKGYELAGSTLQNESAAKALGVRLMPIVDSTSPNSPQQQFSTKPQATRPETILPRKLEDDAYKIYLVKKYPVEYNEILKKHIFNSKLYDTVEDALMAMHKVELQEEADALKKAKEEKDAITEKASSIHKEAQQYIEVLLSNGYELVSTKYADFSVIWEFKTSSNGATFEFRSVDELGRFAKNF